MSALPPRRGDIRRIPSGYGRIVAVKTADVIPKERVFDAMREINVCRPDGEIEIGDVIIENVADTGVAVVATANG